MCQGQFAIPHLSRYWSNRLSSHHCLSSHHGTWNCNFSILTHKLTHGDNCDVMAGSLDEDVEKLRQSLNVLPQPQVEPPLIVVSGLPGTGKSFFCRKLAERLSFLILASDTLRKILFPSPQYKESENKRLFSACHALIEELLGKGIPVIFDATNLLEHHREYLYRAAERSGAKLILVWVEAPTEVVRQRLLARENASVAQYDSEAGWEVYNKMKTRRQRISRNHLVVDTSQDITVVIDKIVRATKR
jgi:predicted kinase